MNLIKIIFFSVFSLFIIFFVIYSWIICYHVSQFGYREGVEKKVIAVYWFIAIFIIVLTLILALSVDWKANPSLKLTF